MAATAAQPAERTDALLPRALAAAWHASSLYGNDHPAVATAIEHLSLATRAVKAPLDIGVEADGLWMKGGAVEPRDELREFAAFLHRGGVAGIQFRAELKLPAARRLLAVLNDYRQEPDNGARLSDLLNDAGKGALTAHQLSASAVRLTPADRQRATRERPFAILSAAGAVGSSVPGEAAAQALARAAVEDFRRCTTNERSGAAHGAIDALQRSLAALTTAQRAELVHGLSADEHVGFDEAAGILNLLPVEQMQSFIDVLRREDSRASAASLRLLRRLANLSLGRPTDLDRLATIAGTWKESTPDEAADRELADATATLLRRLADPDTTPDEYAELLRQLSQSEARGRSTTALLAADELSQVADRSAECIAEVLRAGLGDPDERRTMLRQLGDRGMSMASSGAFDGVLAILALAEEIDRKPYTPEERGLARSLLERSNSEEWIERLIGACGEDGLIARLLTRIGNDRAAARLLVRAASHCQRPSSMRALTRALEALPDEAVLAALLEVVPARPASGNSLCAVIERMGADHVSSLFTPGVMLKDPAQRGAAYQALAQLAPEWPLDLCVRGMLDSEPHIRSTTLNKIARQKGAAIGVLVDCIAGAAGAPTFSPEETNAIASVIAADSSRRTTGRLARRMMAATILPGAARRAAPVEELLRRRRLTPLSAAARIAWIASPLRWVARRRGRRVAT